MTGMNNITLSKGNTTRFSSAPWYEAMQNQYISLVGAGGIGSYLAFNLARLSPKYIEMFDGDTVEEVNMAGQLFKVGDIHKNKARVMQQVLEEYCLFQDSSAYHNFDVTYTVFPITFTALDNMAARKLVYEKWKAEISKKGRDMSIPAIFIDGRLAAEDYQILAIQSHDLEGMKYYEENWLFSDEEADATLCSYKQTSFMASQIAASMTNIFVNYIYNHLFRTPIRSVPRYTEYSGATMEFTLIEEKLSFPILEQVKEEPIELTTITNTENLEPLPTTPTLISYEEWEDRLSTEEIVLLEAAATDLTLTQSEALLRYMHLMQDAFPITEANLVIATHYVTLEADENL